MALPIEDEKQFSVGGFQGIVKVRGLLLDINVDDPPESWENREKQVVKVDMEDTVVLEMLGDEEPMELKDGKFSFFIPYVAAGKTPHKNSIYNRCWIVSAQELGNKPSEFIGQYVTLEKQARTLFDTYVPEDKVEGNMEILLDENDEQIVKKDKIKVSVLAATKEGLPNHFCFVPDETADADNVKGHIRQIITGKNEKAALRELLTDTKAKQFPEFKEKHRDGTLGDYLGLAIVAGVYVTVEEPDADSPS